MRRLPPTWSAIARLTGLKRPEGSGRDAATFTLAKTPQRRSKRQPAAPSKPDLCDLAEAGALARTNPSMAALLKRLEGDTMNLNIFAKIKSMLKSASVLENDAASVIGNLAVGDKKAALTHILEMFETASEGHQTVKATLVEIQGDLAAIGLADPVPAPAATAQVETPAAQVQQPAPAQTAPQTAPLTSPQ